MMAPLVLDPAWMAAAAELEDQQGKDPEPVASPPPMPALLPEVQPPKELALKHPHVECRADLMECSRGVYEGADGEEHKRNPREVDSDMRKITMRHLLARGYFFRVGFACFYLDLAANVLIEVSKDSADLKHLLWVLGYLPKRGHMPAIFDSIIDIAARSPMRPYHRMAYFGPDAIYLRASQNQMYRIKVDKIEQVPIGTDDVILITQDMADLPGLAELEPMMEEMRAAVGRACTQVRWDLPLSYHLTSRWALDSPLSPEQAHQTFITRLMFIFVASRYSLWPIVSLTGEQGSGKSTPLELLLCLLQDVDKAYASSLPSKEDPLIAILSNSSIVCFDNIDGAHLEDPKNGTISDTICHVSTGAEVPKRKLYSDNTLLKYRIQNHALFTAKVDPFASRTDVHRRTITLTMQPAEIQETGSKELLMEKIHEARPWIWAEILLRCQNMVRAHLEYGRNQYRCRSEMVDYENFTYRAAEFEGTLAETQALWEASRTLYLRSITESNPLVHCVRTWLGQRPNALGQQGVCPNAGRIVSPATLFGELEAIFVGTRNFSFRSPTQFGNHIAKQISALKVLGFDRVTVRGGYSYVCHPSAEEQDRSLQQYQDFERAATARALQILSRGSSHGGDRDPMFESEDSPNRTDISEY
jgi:hypothetical protein